MKKLILFLLCGMSFLSVLAQDDIIVTRESEKINAVITEISETEVKYKKSDNPDGPTFVISTSKIASIIYKNGDVQTFQQTEQTTTSPKTTNGTVVTVREAEDIVFVPGQQITKSKRGKYYYGDIELDESLYKDFLKLTCSKAYKNYVNGEGMQYLGSLLTAVGLGFAIGAAFTKSETMLYVDAAVLVAGVASGIPLICVGVKKQNRALDVFNNQCASSLDYKQALSLNFGVTQNGLGLTFNF